MAFSRISGEDANWLERKIKEEEVILAIKACGCERALTLEGFQAEVIEKCWHFIKDDLLKVIDKFEDGGKIN
ncbi:hypothetical protein BVC80_1765g44 [Macleaya cordata]|uniref:Uncharacterized protein n=1 Tax=Macleaya cordata TaxID=56857 RepID=A0A200QTF2_MACCD|nr:hypothetical protein BVC80_1765g44 [Macleaya cordata]